MLHEYNSGCTWCTSMYDRIACDAHDFADYLVVHGVDDDDSVAGHCNSCMAMQASCELVVG